MDGPTTIIALKQIDPEVRIIGSSGLGANGNVAKAVGAGVKHFVSKPYTVEALLKTLHAALEEQT
jgi:DNA-binding NtrC family response regulator